MTGLILKKENHRVTVKRWLLRLTILAVVLYTGFAIWAFSPLNTYDQPEIFQLKLIERWDESHTGAKGHWHERYMGRWQDQATGKLIRLELNSEYYYHTPLGTVIPMLFKPSRLGMIESKDNTHRVLPGVWLVIAGIILTVFCSALVYDWLVEGRNVLSKEYWKMED